MGNYTHEGVEYPSVTTVMQLMAKPHLIQWSANMATDYVIDRLEEISVEENVHHRRDIVDEARHAHDVYRKEAAMIGTTGHSLIENFINTQDREMAGLDEIERIIFESFLDWNDQYKPIWKACELKMHSVQLGVAGSCDAIAEINGELWMIDFKTSKSVYPKDYALQLGAYAICYEEMGNQYGEIDRYAILHLDWREHTVNIVDVTKKIPVSRRSYKLLTDFYYSFAKRRVKNPRVKEFYP